MSGLGGGHHLEQEVGEVGGVGQVHPAPHHTSSGPLAVEMSTKLCEVFMILYLTKAPHLVVALQPVSSPLVALNIRPPAELN